MKVIAYFLSIAVICCNELSSGAQMASSTNGVPTAIFVGSTPCNREVNGLLKIPATDTCVYMKWELNMFTGINLTDSFKLLISYGDYLPNTMYFLGGGKSFILTGKLTSNLYSKDQTSHKVYHLIVDHQEPELLFLQMDNNILHLVDEHMKFVKGDASFGFVLNRLDPIPSK